MINLSGNYNLSTLSCHTILPAVHCGSIRQTATILTMNRDCLRTGDKATVHFRFIKTPEYLHVDQRLVFREGRTKAVGTITKVGVSRRCGRNLCASVRYFVRLYIFKNILFQLLQSTNNQPSNSKPPQIKMQSTKKAAPKREDGQTPATEEAPGTATAACTITTQQQVSVKGKRAWSGL